jgi:hypothetical protein
MAPTWLSGLLQRRILGADRLLHVLEPVRRLAHRRHLTFPTTDMAVHNQVERGGRVKGSSQ